MIWEPFVLALFLGVIVSAGLYFAYLWPSVEPIDELEPVAAGADSPAPSGSPSTVDAAADELTTDEAVQSNPDTEPSDAAGSDVGSPS